MKKLFLVALLFLTACETPSQNVYDYREAGRSVIVEFGTVVDVRPIKIKGQNTGAGAGVGAVGGAMAGSQIGSGDGQVAGAAAGLVAGAVAGAMAEQAMQDREGREFTVVTEEGNTLTIAQYFKKDEPIIQKGERVMVQTSGSYQRILPAEHLPTEIKRPKGIKVVD